MKTYIKSYFLLFLIALFFASCQDESVEIINPDEQEAIIPNSPLSNLMLRTSANAVSEDNVVDNSSCFSVELPVTVIVGNITITIENEEGFDELEELLENFEDEIPEFVFPITIISADYTETVIENQDQLQALLEDCVEDNDAIECVDFVYPISFSVLNSEFVIIDTVTIENNEALHNFLEELDENDINLVALNFPVTLEYANGETVTVNSNIELSDAIESVGDDCDDDDYEDCDADEIRASLKECVWHLDDEFNDFDDLYIDFYEDFTLKINGPDLSEPITGVWEIISNDNNSDIYIVISELTGLNEDLGGDWLVVECDDDELLITKNDFELVLEKDCNEAECNVEEVKDYLQTCIWNAVNITGNEQLLDYDLDFQEEGVLVITVPDAEPITGTWAVVSLTEGIFLSIEGVNAPNIQAVNGYWKLYECEEDRLKFIDGDMFIILEQDCSDDENPFECYPADGVELEKCDDDNDGFATFNIYEAVPDCNVNTPVQITFHLSVSGAEDNTDFLEGATAYTNVTNPQTVYVKVALISNPDEFLIYPVELYVEDCNAPNPFDCFTSFDAVIELCDEGNDGFETFNLTIAYSNCTPFVDETTYHESLADAESGVNPIANPESYVNTSAPQTIYVRAEVGDTYEVFELQLKLEDCNNGSCTEGDVDGILMDCQWKVVELNGDDNLITYRLSFNDGQELVITNTENDETVTGTWSTSTNNEGGVDVLFDGITAADIQAITGNWTVVECTVDQMIFHKGDEQMTLDKICD